MRKKHNQSIKADESTFNNTTVLGQFEGECADATITNKNGLDITQEVWETVFNSEDYKQAIDLKWYIGYLGHPEDPNCMDFEHACIVMTEGHIDPNGKVYGTFDLVDTPVGRIVKSFIDAGVTFGISVRGAGDIVDNSVDPDTFVFRGFDLVTFPAYPEAIPTFTEIAASSDIEKQKKYKAVCAAVKTNIDSLNTCEAVEIVQSQFAKQSDEYKMLENRKNKLTASENLTLTEQQLRGMTELYLKASEELVSARKEIHALRSQIKSNQSIYTRKIKSIQRVMSSQTKDLQDEIFATVQASQVSKAATRKLKQENQRLSIQASKLLEANSSLKDSNLKYKQKIEASADEIDAKDSTIAKLQSELHETVMSSEAIATESSNRDATIKKLRQDITAANQIIQDYQDAYANLYANALGVHVDDVSVTSTTTVNELKSIIGSTSVSQKAASAMEPTHHEDEILNDYNDDDLVTM